MNSAKRNRPAIDEWADTPHLAVTPAVGGNQLGTHPAKAARGRPERARTDHTEGPGSLVTGARPSAVRRHGRRLPVNDHSLAAPAFFLRRKKTVPPPITSSATAMPPITGVALLL